MVAWIQTHLAKAFEAGTDSDFSCLWPVRTSDLGLMIMMMHDDEDEGAGGDARGSGCDEDHALAGSGP